MILDIPTVELIRQTKEDLGYTLVCTSENKVWFIGINRVLFGHRVVAWKGDSVGPSVDYCAGADPKFLAELLSVIAEIFRNLPESVSEHEVEQLMPSWQTRPINGDPCWAELVNLATQTK